MTLAAAPSLAIEPARVLPNGELFYSPIGLYDFQADDVARAYLETNPDAIGGKVATWDMGLGKTVLTLALAAYLFEDNQIDMVFLACEQNKIRDWVRDVEKFTALSVLRYHDGGRQKRLAKAGVPHVLVTTHETGRADLMTRVKAPGKRGKGTAGDGPLFETLGLRDKRILWVWDEPKLRTRSSAVYASYEYALKALRKGPHHQRALALTGTPYETSPEDGFNLARVLAPEHTPNVGVFEATYGTGRDRFGNLTFNTSSTQRFARDHFLKLTMRRRKTDPEVIDQFPKLIEKKVVAPLAGDQRKFYEGIEVMFDPPEGEEDERTEAQIIADAMKIAAPLRLTAGHPAAHLHVDNEVSRDLVDMFGAEGLRAIGSGKTDELIARLRPLIKGQRSQALIFEFHTSVIIEVVRELRAAGFTVGEYHGRQSDRDNEHAKQAFLDGEVEILFASDKAARGLNLQNAEYTIEYSPAFTYSVHAQRINRANRIDSTLPSNTCITMVLEDTVDEDTLAEMVNRNRDQDALMGDDNEDVPVEFITASERRKLLQARRRRS